MPFVPVANTALVQLIFGLDDQRIENTLYFEAVAPPDVAALNTLAADAAVWWEGFMAPNLSSGISLIEVLATALDSETAPSITYNAGLPAPGLLGAEAMSNNVAFTISFRTALRGRSFRGRNYVAGMTVDQVSQSRVIGVAMAAWVNAYNQIPTEIAGATWTWVVVSRFSGIDAEGDPIPRAAGVTTPVTVAAAFDNVVDSQRRRLPGRGT